MWKKYLIMCWTVLSRDVTATRAGNVLPHLKTGLLGYRVSIGRRHGRDIWDIYVVLDNTYFLFWAFCMPSTWKKAINICLLPFACVLPEEKLELTVITSTDFWHNIILRTGLFFNPTIFDSKGKQESPGEDWQDPAHRATVTCDGWTWGYLASVVLSSLY